MTGYESFADDPAALCTSSICLEWLKKMDPSEMHESHTQHRADGKKKKKKKSVVGGIRKKKKILRRAACSIIACSWFCVFPILKISSVHANQAT